MDSLTGCDGFVAWPLRNDLVEVAIEVDSSFRTHNDGTGFLVVVAPGAYVVHLQVELRIFHDTVGDVRSFHASLAMVLAAGHDDLAGHR